MSGAGQSVEGKAHTHKLLSSALLGRGLTAATKKSPAPSGGLRNPFVDAVFEDFLKRILVMLELRGMSYMTGTTGLGCDLGCCDITTLSPVCAHSRVCASCTRWRNRGTLSGLSMAGKWLSFEGSLAW